MKKIAVVTGATSGMGQETVIFLADRFEKLDEIWVIGRRRERLERLAEEVPVKLRLFALDLADRDHLEEVRQALIEDQPDVKFLVNAAGFGKIGPFGSVDVKEETGMVRINCESMIAVTHMILPFMSDNSRILQFASAAAFVPQPDFAIYAATKAFVLSFSRALNSELKNRRICVTAVCPGPVKTEFFDIAEATGKIPLYKKLTMADPKKVVRQAVRDSIMGRSISVYGVWMKLFFALCKVLPHEVVLKIMEYGR